MPITDRAFRRIRNAASRHPDDLDLEAVEALPDFVLWHGRHWSCADCGAQGRNHRTPADAARAVVNHVAREHGPARDHRTGNALLLGHRVHVVCDVPDGARISDTGLFLDIRQPGKIHPDAPEWMHGDYYEFDLDREGYRVLPRTHVRSVTEVDVPVEANATYLDQAREQELSALITRVLERSTGDGKDPAPLIARAILDHRRRRTGHG
ncbi:hypothetical protein HDA32_005818 [Spinactinospora alkalitolerans]|uniref:Uncharacterized protein n=1 Tax=Spinactinospora alkalitolerans TaxID=687207 RepID=A0A852U392_9ACTN|nr:hypothetical protein [Spinactinospora alkalitolerans]NYE50698.1 hypothetical protein [Spinactinospora alkalitolerans]